MGGVFLLYLLLLCGWVGEWVRGRTWVGEEISADVGCPHPMQHTEESVKVGKDTRPDGEERVDGGRTQGGGGGR